MCGLGKEGRFFDRAYNGEWPFHVGWWGGRRVPISPGITGPRFLTYRDMMGVLPPGIVFGSIPAPDCHFSPVSDRPVSGIFEGRLTGNPAIGPVCLSGDFARRKTGLFRACFNRGSGEEMRFGLWGVVIRDPAVAMGGLAGSAFYVGVCVFHVEET